MKQQNNDVRTRSHLIDHVRRSLCAGSSELRVLALVVAGLLATIGVSGVCTWGWATQNCESYNCQGSCTNTEVYVNTKHYCQQQGAICCECKEKSYRCSTTGICSTTFWYAREKSESETGDCPLGQNGIACVE